LNDTVAGAKETVGGVLDESGVGKVTEGAVDGIAGPKSVVGQRADEAVDAVGGLLEEGQ
jgi:hypothetical protein